MALDPLVLPEPQPHHVLKDSALCHQADYWQSRCNDLKKSLNQVKAELYSVQEKERSLTLRNAELESYGSLEEEVYELRNELADSNEHFRHLHKESHAQLSEMQRRLDSALRNSKSKDDLCENMRLQLQSKARELEKVKEELQEAKNLRQKEQESHHRSMAELRAKLEASDKMKDEELRAKEEQLHEEEALRDEAVSELSSLRQRLKVAQEQANKHSKMTEVLQSEKDLWISRSAHYKKQYYEHLRYTHCSDGDTTDYSSGTMGMSLNSRPVTPTPWRHFSRTGV
eukprot:Skav233556  [mRNA]  locus=scaffold563:478255:479109:+ [translate_table: standard]